MRHRLTQQKSISFTEDMMDKIQTTADTLNVSFQDIVRECVEIELPKLIDRERKRTKRGQITDRKM
ncbi:MAG: hypothetical protein OXH65_06360 [Paracoccaceae bacterium]|nr:hypothetical protein [Paracoccaceae bacterium]